MENCVAPGLDEFDVLLEVVLSLVRVSYSLLGYTVQLHIYYKPIFLWKYLYIPVFPWVMQTCRHSLIWVKVMQESVMFSAYSGIVWVFNALLS